MRSLLRPVRLRPDVEGVYMLVRSEKVQRYKPLNCRAQKLEGGLVVSTDRVYFLDAGYLYIDKSILTAGRGYGEIMKSTLYMTLLSRQRWVGID